MKPDLKKIFTWILKKEEVNYLYFGLLLVLISGFSLIHFLSLDGPLFGLPLFFLLYSIGQALLEVWIFIFIAYLLSRWSPRWVLFLFISLSFVFFLCHLTHFFLVRLIDASLAYFFKFFFGSGIDHFFAAFQALNMNPMMIGIIFFSIFAVPFTGIFLYRLTQKIAKKKPWSLSFSQIVMTVGLLTTTLLFLDFLLLPHLSHTHLQKTLPLGHTFLSPSPQCIQLSSPLAPPRSEKWVRKQLPLLTASSKPNLYFFVVETLRKDFVTKETAPHLVQFAEENFQFPLSFANATSTQLSWFALFHSDFPHTWAAMRDQWSEGSIPLQLLKNLGYQIRVYSSANLCFYKMDELIFGKKRKLADQICEYSQNPIEPWERDALGLRDFESDLKSPSGKEGNVFLFFLDSTHSEYSFPKDFSAPFQPFPKQIDYLTLTPKDIEPIKNRYKNAIAYVDTLFHRFFTLLKRENLYEQSIIAITGDHGEEFFEEGALFHGTHLNHPQTSVPIFLKFQNNPLSPQTKQVTHIDLFPSLLHFLTGTEDFHHLFDGTSIFASTRWPYRIAVLQNGPCNPCEFTLEREDERFHLKILEPTKLEVLSEFPPEEALQPLLENSSLETTNSL